MAFKFNQICKFMDNGFKYIPEFKGYCSRFVKTTKKGDVVSIVSDGSRAVRKASGTSLISVPRGNGYHDIYRSVQGGPVELLRHGNKSWEQTSMSRSIFNNKLNELLST